MPSYFKKYFTVLASSDAADREIFFYFNQSDFNHKSLYTEVLLDSCKQTSKLVEFPFYEVHSHISSSQLTLVVESVILSPCPAPRLP